MLRVLAAAVGVALGLAATGPALAQEEPTTTIDVPSSDGGVAGGNVVNANGADVFYGDIGPGTQISEPVEIVGSVSPPAAPAEPVAPVPAPVETAPPAEGVVVPAPSDGADSATYNISQEDGRETELGIPGFERSPSADASPGTIEGLPEGLTE